MDEEVILTYMLAVKEQDISYQWDELPIIFASLLVKLSEKLSEDELNHLIAFGVIVFERQKIANALYQIQTPPIEGVPPKQGIS